MEAKPKGRRKITVEIEKEKNGMPTVLRWEGRLFSWMPDQHPKDSKK